MIAIITSAIISMFFCIVSYIANTMYLRKELEDIYESIFRVAIIDNVLEGDIKEEQFEILRDHLSEKTRYYRG